MSEKRNEGWVERVLDSRESAEFDQAWMAAFDLIKSLSISDKKAIDSVRELAFKRAFAITGNPDIAVFVSDDFELISKAEISEISLPFIQTILFDYQEGRFPAGVK